MSSNKGKALKQQKTVAKITVRGGARANSSQNRVENSSPKAGGSSDGHTTSLRQSSRPRKRKAVFGEDNDTIIASKPKSVTRVTKVNKPDTPELGVFEDITASQVVSVLGDPLLTSTQKVHEELRADEHDQDAQPLGTESDLEDPSYNGVNDNSSGSSDTEKYEETRNEENLSDDNNSSGSDEDDYVVHSQRKLTKEGDKGRIEAAPANMNTFNESLLTDKSVSRPQIVLSPEAMQRKFFEMDLNLHT
ncbi:uncharacterized protein LOC124190009 [Daphnia pulex]|uniref:uncharacterized protein LOC124190009 n=1 Tax=Daphnia pulex TaxID=6669 RepID=UPI001EDE9F17|nr:uncharacterized protein LOC124190009 [Daphnia pulex]